MRTIGNILWVVISGFWSALGWLFLAALLALTIIGFPFARQCMKIAHFSLWPFGRTVVPSPTARRGSLIGNILWFLPGVLIAVMYAISGVILFITIIGIPFGIQSFKLIPLALSPFGKEIVRVSELKVRMETAAAPIEP